MKEDHGTLYLIIGGIVFVLLLILLFLGSAILSGWWLAIVLDVAGLR